MKPLPDTPLLEVQNATKIYGGGFLSGQRKITALRDCRLTLHETPARITAIAGESGSGKSTLAGAVLGFVQLNEGKVLYQGHDVAAMTRQQRFDYRRQVQAIFQDPYAVFNPFYRTSHLFHLVLRRFKLAQTPKEARQRMEEALEKVGLRGAEVLDKHPHQLSGGQRQRIMVARAYLMAPRLIVADEPVSMVDASLRSMILDIMLRMRDENGISFLYITHDLSTAYQICDDIHIFYRGAQVENGPVTEVLTSPRHPYTQLLLESIPQPDPAQRWAETIPPAAAENEGDTGDNACPFYPRCPQRFDQCRNQRPAARSVTSPEHAAACHHYPEDSGK
jgi:peptide/nickel transport system ATP-binding protein